MDSKTVRWTRVYKMVTFFKCAHAEKENIVKFIFVNIVRPYSRLECTNLENFYPCKCSVLGKKDFSLECINASVDQVLGTFNSTLATDFEYIFLEAIDFFIPKDLFVNHRFKIIELNGNERNPGKCCPEIHPEAFRSSRDVSKNFQIASLNMSKMNLSFLTDFNQLTYLFILQVVDAHLSGLPQLPNLLELKVTYSSGLNKWTNFPHLENGIEHLILAANALNDDCVDRILDSLLKSPTKNTLQYLHLAANALTRIPQQIKYFPVLHKIYLDHQQAPGFGYISPLYSTSFMGSIRFMYLPFCFITELEPNAFEGYFSLIYVYV